MSNKTFRPRLRIPKKELRNLYVSEKMSVGKIAEHFGCDRRTINRLRRMFGIPKRFPKNGGHRIKRTDITKDFLLKEYIQNHKTMRQVGDMIGASDTLIHKHLTQYNIPTRGRGEDLRGRKLSKEQRIRMSFSKAGRRYGKNCHNWKGGVSFNAAAIRKTRKYSSFRKRVLIARGDICEICKKNLLEGCPTCKHVPDRHVHHIKPFSRYEEERFSESNVIVLCDSCHKSQHY